MIRAKLLTGVLSILFIFSSFQIFAGEIPSGYMLATKEKPIMGQGTIIKVTDELDTDLGYVYVIVGTCKKIPFQLGPVFIEGGNFASIDEENFDQFFLYGMVPPECKPPENYAGYAIVGFDNLFFLNGVISGEAVLQAVVPASSP